MKTRQFNVPEEIIYQFAELLTEKNVGNWIEGVSEDEDGREISIIAEFEKDQENLIDELNEMIEDYFEDEEEEKNKSRKGRRR